MFKDVEVVDNPCHVEVGVLVGKLDSGVTYVTSFRVVVVAPTGEHARSAVDREHVGNKGAGLGHRGLHRDDRDVAEARVVEGVDKGEGCKEAKPHSHSK